MLVGYAMRKEGRKDVCVMWGCVEIRGGGAEEKSEL